MIMQIMINFLNDFYDDTKCLCTKFFLAPWDLKFEIRPMSHIVLCDIHHIKSVLTTYHLPEYNYFTRSGKQKQKLSDQFLGVLYLMIKPVILIISLL